MPPKLPGHEATLHKRCDEVLHYLWDPIGVAGAPGARDEYESYVPQVVKLLHDGAEEEQISGYLVRVEGGRMGLSPDVSPPSPRPLTVTSQRGSRWMASPGWPPPSSPAEVT